MNINIKAKVHYTALRSKLGNHYESFWAVDTFEWHYIPTHQIMLLEKGEACVLMSRLLVRTITYSGLLTTFHKQFIAPEGAELQ